MFRNTLSGADVAGMLVDWLEENDAGAEPRHGYSGRGMFGRRCFGLVGSIEEIHAALIGFVADNPQTADIVRELVRGQKRDNMGMDMIVYFPGVDIESKA